MDDLIQLCLALCVGQVSIAVRQDLSICVPLVVPRDHVNPLAKDEHRLRAQDNNVTYAGTFTDRVSDAVRNSTCHFKAHVSGFIH